MDFRSFLPDLKSWTLREIACAAGLMAWSAGAGYCLYRSLRGGSAPPEHSQPPHEPEDVLEESSDTPSVLQVVEPNLQLLPTEPHYEASAVVLPINAGEQISAWRNVQFISVDFCRSQSGDDQVDTSTWVQENIQDCPCSDSWSQPDFEESCTPEELEVPFISSHLADRGVTEIGLKLRALRQAFSTLLASIHNQNFVFVVGKKIMMRLAAANNQNAVGVQLAYESLIQFLRRPSNRDWIEAELSGAEIHHYNFLDVFYELLVFGYFTNGSAPEAFEGGFLERLLALISMWDVDEWEPAAGTYFTVLLDQLTALPEVLFSQPVELYSDPAALASAVLCLLRNHVQLMMDNLERL